MAATAHTSSRILLVGGGVSGLSIAARIAQAGLPVTVLEASDLGFGASTRNQGWLVSGGWFAPDHPELARLCHESLQQTLQFCPDCLEPECSEMVYLAERSDTDLGRWTAAWRAAGIPYQELTAGAVQESFPDLKADASRSAFRLPDRAIQAPVLLQRLARAATEAGAEIRTGLRVANLIYQDEAVQGVRTCAGEEILAGLVVLAGNARGGGLEPGFGTRPVGAQEEVALMCLKTHLVALRPGIGRTPLCVIDAGGFSHLPHPPVSVFGSNRWVTVSDAENEQPDPAELTVIWDHLGRLFPTLRREGRDALEWAGTTIQAMHVEQIHAGQAPLPTVVDHARERPAIANLVSVFPGRASLWPILAESARQQVLEKLDATSASLAAPPWGKSGALWNAPLATTADGSPD